MYIQLSTFKLVNLLMANLPNNFSLDNYKFACSRREEDVSILIVLSNKISKCLHSPPRNCAISVYRVREYFSPCTCTWFPMILYVNDSTLDAVQYHAHFRVGRPQRTQRIPRKRRQRRKQLQLRTVSVFCNRGLDLYYLVPFINILLSAPDKNWCNRVFNSLIFN